MRSTLLRPGLAALSLFAVALAGCDSGPEADANVTVQGRVTDDDATARLAPVEGAVVTAASVSASGSVRPLDGEATTTASGSYTLETSGTLDAVVVSAAKESFETSALIEADGAARGTALAPPMTAETDAEAAVYVAARAEGSRARVADAAFFVTSEVAADIEAGRTTADEVAAALDASLRAEARQARNDDVDDDEVERADDERDEAYGAFRVALHATASASASTAAFTEAYSAAYAEAGASAEAQARAAWARALATAKFVEGMSSRTAASVRLQAQILAATATGHAVEAAFRARGAGQARLSALQAARTQLVAALRAAATEAGREAAEAAYAAAVTVELAAETEITASQLAAATSATASARTSLAASLDAASTGDAVAAATTSFFRSAESAVDDALDADAGLAAEVLVLISVF